MQLSSSLFDTISGLRNHTALAGRATAVARRSGAVGSGRLGRLWCRVRAAGRLIATRDHSEQRGVAPCLTS